MKLLQKLILPGLIILSIGTIYIFYFSPDNTLGSLSDFDINNSANKEIKVKIDVTKEIQVDQQSGTSIFYAVDKNGTEFMVQAPLTPAAELKSAEIIVLKGHLHKDYFHAAEILK